MKKILVLALSALMMTALVGCGAKNGNIDKESNLKENTKEESTKDNAQNDSKNEILFAKVKNVVGNEISIKLSDGILNMPQNGEDGGMQNSLNLDEGQMGILENGGAVTLDDGGVIGSATKDPNADQNLFSDGGTIELEEPMPMGDGEGALVVGADGGALQDGVMSFGTDSLSNGDMFSGIEFNGEEKDLTIPAGAEIFNLKTGKKGTMSDIKEGSILSIVIDGKNNTVTRIDIMG